MLKNTLLFIIYSASNKCGKSRKELERELRGPGDIHGKISIL